PYVESGTKNYSFNLSCNYDKRLVIMRLYIKKSFTNQLNFSNSPLKNIRKPQATFVIEIHLTTVRQGYFGLFAFWIFNRLPSRPHRRLFSFIVDTYFLNRPNSNKKHHQRCRNFQQAAMSFRQNSLLLFRIPTRRFTRNDS